MVNGTTSYTKFIRKKKDNYNRNKTMKIEANRYQNAKEYWSLLKGLSSQSKTTNKLDTSDFYEYFKAVNNPDSIFFQPDEDTIHFNERYLNGEFQIMFTELDSRITPDEISKACRELNSGKSTGPDLMMNEVFKCDFKHLNNYLHALFNKLLDTGYFPDEWRESYVIPLHKKGDVNNVENYRGISLMSHFCKLFTRILNNRLNKWAEDYSVYSEAQAGFRKKMGTVDNIFVLNGLINHFINANKKLYVAMIDFRKAYDYVVRDTLWRKLIQLGVRGKILNIIKSMYKQIESNVKYNNNVSDSYTHAFGVVQGDCLSSLMFALYVNDIEQVLETSGFEGITIDNLKMFILLYADDIALISETEWGLQNGLDILYNYCTSSKLVINTQKSKVLVFKKGRQTCNSTTFMYNNEPLEIVNTFNYLGVVL